MEEISELKREGLSIRAISRLTGYGRKTIRKYLLTPAGRPVYGPRPAAVSKREPFNPYLKDRLQAGVWNAQVLLRELREQYFLRGILESSLGIFGCQTGKVAENFGLGRSGGQKAQDIGDRCAGPADDRLRAD